MEIKYSNYFLNKLEDVLSESDYHLRYEKGNFKSGFCVLKDTKIVIVNKYYTTEGKINCLVDIIKEVDMNTDEMTEKNENIYMELKGLIKPKNTPQTKLDI